MSDSMGSDPIVKYAANLPLLSGWLAFGIMRGNGRL